MLMALRHIYFQGYVQCDGKGTVPGCAHKVGAERGTKRHPFDPSYFAVKVHPSGALLFTPHHSQLTLLQHIIIQAPFLKQPVQFLADIPKLDDSHRWKAEETIAWLRKHGLHSVPNSIKADIGDLVYNGPKKTALDETSNFAPPPGRFVYFTGSRASNDPPPGL